MGKRRIVIIAAVVAACAAAGGLTAWRLHDWPAHHYGMVTEGRLYRSGQPGRFGWRNIFGRGVRTVISVREIDADADWFGLEDRLCAERGVRLIRMPIGRMSDRELTEFATVMADPASHPVLVHCEAGSVRTGVLIAAYRIAHDEWDYDRAVAEAKSYRFRPEVYKPYTDYLRDLAARVGAGSNPLVPTPAAAMVVSDDATP